jgi:hypothetical protein
MTQRYYLPDGKVVPTVLCHRQKLRFRKWHLDSLVSAEQNLEDMFHKHSPLQAEKACFTS